MSTFNLILANCPSKRTMSIYMPTHGSTWKQSRIIRRNLKSAVDRMLYCQGCSWKTATALVWVIENFFFFFFNSQLRHFKTITICILPGNLYTMEELLYICSRHLANYWGAKVCLGTKNTKVAVPFFLPRNMQCSTASGAERYLHCFFKV